MTSRKDQPTIIDVAREAGVSKTTASYVLSGSIHAKRFSENTRKRITNAAQILGYNRNSIGAALKRGYSDNLILLAVTWELSTGHERTMTSISRAASEKGFSTTIHIALDDDEANNLLCELPSTNPYGLLLLWDSLNISIERISELRSQGLPIVDLLPPQGNEMIGVTADRDEAGFLSTDHLLRLGHRNIGILIDTVYRWKTNRQKLSGYKRALESYGVSFDDMLLQEVPGYGYEGGYQGMKSLLDRRPDVTAVICINDPMAIGAINSAQDMGLLVPDDLSVVGYGAFPEGVYIRPHLTTVSSSSANIAYQAVEMLIRQREGVDNTKSIYEPVKLIVRESSGPPVPSPHR